MKKVAVVGAGNIFETVHYPCFTSHKDDCEIVALIDTNIERLKAAAEKYSIPNYYASTEELFSQITPDVVVVCTPNKFHHKTVMDALTHGCNVLCEKPPAINADEAFEMMTFAEEKNLVLAYNLHHRHSENVGLLKKEIEKGTLGNIYNVKVSALRRRGVPGWGNFLDKNLQGGGPLIDIGVHMLDTALYLLDYPKIKRITASAYCEIGNRKSRGLFGNWNPGKFTVEDSIFAFLQLENNISMFLEASFALNIKQKDILNVELHGSEAGASVYPLEIYSDLDGELSDMTFPFVNTRNSHETSISRFLDRCNGKRAVIANGREGYYLQRIMDGIYKSSELGESVQYE